MFKWFVLSLVLMCNMHCFAQQKKELTIEEQIAQMQKRMMETQRKMLEQMQQSPFEDGDWTMPEGDSTFFFKFDTTFSGDGFRGSFHFSTPFGNDSVFEEFNKMFEDMMRGNGLGVSPFEEFDQEQYDSGQMPEGDENLLPEERLQKQEELEKQRNADPKSAPDKPEPAPKKKLKTVRI